MSKTVLTFITDTHHYSKTLGVTGEAYMLRSESDQKCLAETGEILDYAFENLANSDCDAVMVIGDVSNDGEKVCHEEFREKLYKLKENKNVYVVTATHDWCCDQNPRRYEGDKVLNDVPTLTSEELYDFYADFSVNDAFSEYKTHIGTASYAVDIGENVTLIGLIDDKNEENHAGFVPEHFEWIIQQIKSAKERGRVPVAMEHHPLMSHITPLLKGVGKGYEYLDAFADAGLEFLFVGHTHMQRIDEHISPNGNKIYEINVASLVGYPAPMVTMSVSDEEINISTEFLKECTINGEKVDLTGFLKDHATKMFKVIFKSAEDKVMLEKRLRALNMNPKKLMGKYYIIKPIFKGISNLTVKKAGRLLNTMTFGKAIPKDSIKQYANTKVLDVVGDMFLSVLDGGIKKYNENDSFYKLVRGAMSTPLRISKKLKTKEKTIDICEKIDLAMHEILTGGNLDNHTLTVRRK